MSFIITCVSTPLFTRTQSTLYFLFPSKWISPSELSSNFLFTQVRNTHSFKFLLTSSYLSPTNTCAFANQSTEPSYVKGTDTTAFFAASLDNNGRSFDSQRSGNYLSGSLEPTHLEAN